MEHPLLCGKPDTELGLFSLRKQKLREISSVCKYLKVQIRQSQAAYAGAQCQDKSQWAQTGIQEVCSEHQEAFLYFAGF